MPNPDNPFVLDPNFFDSYANKTIFKETSLYTFRLINNSVVFGLNIFLSSLLFYLIFNEMPSTFKPYRKMLILSTTMDTYAGFVYFITQVVSYLGIERGRVFCEKTGYMFLCF
jgi:hypothetical protein